MIRGICAVALALGCPALSWGAAHHVILSGSGGEAEFQERFAGWTARLQDALLKQAGADAARIHVLAADPAGKPDASGGIRLEAIQAMFADLAAQSQPADDVFVYLIGHGSYLDGVTKFHIPGPDLNAKELKGLLDAVPSRRALVIAAVSSGASYVNELSGPNRIICSAAKSVDEINAPVFMENFIKGMEDGAADRDHDDRISILEACEYAAELTDTWYTTEGYKATEHAILDDNGDGLGSRLPLDQALADALAPEPATDTGIFDGKTASEVYLKDFVFPESVPREIVDQYLAALDAVTALRERKTGMSESDYLAELEKLLVQAARANREIHRHLPAVSP